MLMERMMRTSSGILKMRKVKEQAMRRAKRRKLTVALH
jgi:hypothetical protein